ncbi:hypothetical protein BKA65DRAFT_484091 [Rhexocercosporidium sp. MPI-PUGE-AT-0058]|nr:hypothetical protein BKA65DRAFT_484091 [Rhexocercosporidium sp. MPI-PUGE-AT-0058]
MTPETSVRVSRNRTGLRGCGNSPGDISDRIAFNIMSRRRTLAGSAAHTYWSKGSFLPSEDTLSQEDRSGFTNRFKTPSSFWTRLAQDASGFVGSKVTRDASGNLESYGLLFRFLIKEPHETGQIIHDYSGVDYVWHRLGFFTYWMPVDLGLIFPFASYVLVCRPEQLLL